MQLSQAFSRLLQIFPRLQRFECPHVGEADVARLDFEVEFATLLGVQQLVIDVGRDARYAVVDSPVEAECILVRIDGVGQEVDHIVQSHLFAVRGEAENVFPAAQEADHLEHERMSKAWQALDAASRFADNAEFQVRLQIPSAHRIGSELNLARSDIDAGDVLAQRYLIQGKAI